MARPYPLVPRCRGSLTSHRIIRVSLLLPHDDEAGGSCAAIFQVSDKEKTPGGASRLLFVFGDVAMGRNDGGISKEAHEEEEEEEGSSC
jgi:hypothetical protein